MTVPAVEKTGFDVWMISYNIRLIRYSDVLLMYAEALNEWKGAPTEEAYDAVNEIRLRAGIDEVEDLNYKQFQSLIQMSAPANSAMKDTAGSTLYDGEYSRDRKKSQ